MAIFKFELINKLSHFLINQKRTNRENFSIIQNSFKNNNKAFAIISLILFGLFTALFGWQLKSLKFDYAFESFFPKGDPDLAFYDQIISDFGQENDFLFLAIKDVDLENSATWPHLFQLENDLEAFNEIHFVQSIFDESVFQITPFGINQVKFVQPKGPSSLEDLLNNESLQPYFGKDHRSILMTIRHVTSASKEIADQFYAQLDQWLSENLSYDYEVSGKIQMQSDFTSLLEQELGKLLVIGLSLALIALVVIYRSLKGILLPVVIMFSSVIWTMGLMALLGKPIDVMIVMLPVILIILSISDVVHLVNKYDSLLKEQVAHQEAILLSIKTVGKATFTTSFTTAIGFLGLLFLPIIPIKEFGLFAAIGVMIAYGLTILVVPSILYFYPNPISKLKLRTSPSDGLLRTGKKVTLLTIVGAIVISSGALLINKNTGLIVGLQKKEALLEKVAYFDENFGGYRPFELTIDIDSLFELNTLSELEEIEEVVYDVYNVQNLITPLSLIRRINSGLYGGAISRNVIPIKKDLSRVKRFYKSPKLEGNISPVDNGNGRLRFLGTTNDLGSNEFHQLNEVFYSRIEELQLQNTEVRLTGTSFLIDKTDNLIIAALLKGLALACLTVGLITYVVHKKIKLAVIITLVNIMPLATLFGIMGWLHIDLNISTIIIFTVAFGIAVDDSIHFISSYMQKLKEGLPKSEALSASYNGTGRSIIHTSGIMILGFICLMSSGLSAVYYLGLFICLISLIALWFDLKVLPWLLLKTV